MQSKIIRLDEITQNLVIPAYQRLYEWDEQQIRKFLDDILKAKQEYFIGTITTSIKNHKLKNQDLVIIDGQQRLSTLIFLCAFMSAKSQTEFINAYKFAFIKPLICRLKIPLKEQIIEKISKYDFQNICFKIDKAFEIFNDYDLNKLHANLFTNIKLNLVILGDINWINYFLSLNENFVQLEQCDILKARLLESIKDDENYSHYSNILNECMQMDKLADFNNTYKALSIDEILHTEQTVLHERINESIVDFSTFILHVFRILFGEQIELNPDKLLEIANNLITKENAIKIIDACKFYREIFDQRCLRKSENEFKLLGSLQDTKLVEFLNYLRVAREPNEYLSTLLISDEAKLFEDLKNLDDKLANQREIEELYYSHPKITYWLQRLEYYLLQSELISKNYKNLYRFRELNSIEHIYPQSVKKLDDLGNLALISGSENSQFSDKNFTDKKSLFEDFVKRKKILSLKLVLIYQNSTWSEREIAEHGKAMKQILRRSFSDESKSILHIYDIC